MIGQTQLFLWIFGKNPMHIINHLCLISPETEWDTQWLIFCFLSHKISLTIQFNQMLNSTFHVITSVLTWAMWMIHLSEKMCKRRNISQKLSQYVISQVDAEWLEKWNCFKLNEETGLASMKLSTSHETIANRNGGYFAKVNDNNETFKTQIVKLRNTCWVRKWKSMVAV